MTGRTGRWEVGVAATIALAAVGLLAREGTLLIAAAIPLAYVGYGSLSGVRTPADLEAVRRIDASPAPPGRPVAVELSVTNAGESALADLRVVDGVPESLAVVDGTPRAGETLEPGESIDVEYVVVPRRGEYEFDAPRLRVRGAGAGAVADARPTTDGDDHLVCRLDAEAPPLTDHGTEYVGTLTSDRPGQGVEFHSTREYRRGDPASGIDWRHFAKRGTLTSVNYARQVAATVILVVDVRPSARVVAGPGRPTAAELCAYAATRSLSDLLVSGHDVAVAVLGVDGEGPAGLGWLPPGGGGDHRSRALSLLRGALDGGGSEVDVATQARELVELTPPGAQLALCSPALDDGPVTAVEAWSAFDYPLTVLSPDVLSANTIGGQFEGVRRQTRLARCQAAGARAIDWRRGTPLSLVLEYAFAVDAKLGETQRRRRVAGGDV